MPDSDALSMLVAAHAVEEVFAMLGELVGSGALRRCARRGAVAAVVVVGATALPALAPAAPSQPSPRSDVTVLSGHDAERTAPAGVARDAGEARAHLRSAPGVARRGWSAFVDVDDGAAAAALSWHGEVAGELRVRGRTSEGWTAWTSVEGDADEGPDGASRTASSMVWFGERGITDVEVRVEHGSLEDLELQTVRFPVPRQGTFGIVGAGATASMPTIQPRSAYTSASWASGNPGCGSGPTTASGGVRFAVLHHTVNANTYAASDVPAMLAAIRAFHTGTNGWCDIAYNFVIDRFGRIWEARMGSIAGAVVGGHARGFNTGSVGVAFLGQHEPGASPASAAPSSAALAAAARLVAWKLGQNGIDAAGSTSVVSGGSNRWPSGQHVTVPRVAGHRDLGLTSCPGSLLYAQLASVRSSAHALQGGGGSGGSGGSAPDPRLAPFTTSEALVRRQFADVLRRPPSASELAYWTARVPTSWSAAAFTTYLLVSAEADARVDAVTRIYEASLLRIPDRSGFAYWVDRRGAGASIASIAGSFAVSSEFRSRYGHLDDAGYVDRIYRNVLGRAPDQVGRAYWLDRLTHGTSRGQLLASFSESAEHVRATESSTRVVAVYQDLLGRAPSAGVHGLAVASLELGATFGGLVAQLLASQEYRDRI